MFLAIPGLSSLGPTEFLIIILVLVVLFGAKKLPELARGSGRAIRIFKAETKGLMDDDDDDDLDPDAPKQLNQAVPPPQAAEPGQPAAPAQPLPPTHTEN